MVISIAIKKLDKFHHIYKTFSKKVTKYKNEDRKILLNVKHYEF